MAADEEHSCIHQKAEIHSFKYLSLITLLIRIKQDILILPNSDGSFIFQLKVKKYVKSSN